MRKARTRLSVGELVRNVFRRPYKPVGYNHIDDNVDANDKPDSGREDETASIDGWDFEGSESDTSLDTIGAFVRSPEEMLFNDR